MTRAVPLPSWRDLAAMKAGAGAFQIPAPPWDRRPGDRMIWTSRSAWSLAALTRAASQNLGRPCRVAVPAYICNQSLWPLRREQCRLHFYPVDPSNLTPDWGCSDLETDCDLFILVHYFGWSNDLDGAAAYCRRKNALLVEDCAHVLRPFEQAGSTGDAAVFSPHKMLAVPDGAVLRLGGKAASWEQDCTTALKDMGDAAPDHRSWRLRRFIQKTPAAGLIDILRPPGQADFMSDPTTQDMAPQTRISAAALDMIVRTDFDFAARRRRANARTMAELVLDQSGCRVLFDPSKCPAPYRLPLLCKSEDHARALFQACRAIRFPAESWPDLPPEVDDASARRLRRHVLLLPCHQDLDPDACRRNLSAALAGTRQAARQTAPR